MSTQCFAYWAHNEVLCRVWSSVRRESKGEELPVRRIGLGARWTLRTGMSSEQHVNLKKDKKSMVDYYKQWSHAKRNDGTDRQIDRRTNEWKDGRTDRRTGGRAGEQAGSRVGAQACRQCFAFSPQKSGIALEISTSRQAHYGKAWNISETKHKYMPNANTIIWLIYTSD